MSTSPSCPRRFAGTLLVLSLIAGTPLRASDTVVVRSEPGGKERRVTGTVTEFTGEFLLIQHTSGREEKISSTQVVEVLGDWTASNQAANGLFAEANFEAAEAKYREALRDEQRRWVKRRILAQLTWCYRALGQTDKAVKAFLPLFGDDPQTPYFAAIPLTWTAGQPDLDTERQAAAWMQDNDSSAARLIGASWSLTSPRRAEAINLLRKFVGDPDPRIAFLAEAQLWRTQVVTARADELGRWQERIERMPTTIRGGPYYVLGLALSRQKMHEPAAISFMRAAILYSSERDLVPDALLAAGRELETMEQPTEAAGLYREILTKFAAHRVASEAERRLKQPALGK